MIIDGTLKVGSRVVWRSLVRECDERFMKGLRERHGDGPFVVEKIEAKKFTVVPQGAKPDPGDTHLLTVSSNGRILTYETESNRPATFSSYWFEQAPS